MTTLLRAKAVIPWLNFREKYFARKKDFERNKKKKKVAHEIFFNFYFFLTFSLFFFFDFFVDFFQQTVRDFFSALTLGCMRLKSRHLHHLLKAFSN